MKCHIGREDSSGDLGPGAGRLEAPEYHNRPKKPEASGDLKVPVYDQNSLASSP